MAANLMSLFDELDSHTADHRGKDTDIVRAPFAYPGAKRNSIDAILPLLPYTSCYVEPFGGSGAVLLARRSCRLEVLNDRYAGVVAFYRCVRDPEKLGRLCDWLDLTIHSREEFVWAKETHQTVGDDVERAARWFYMIAYSFGSLGRNYGRSTAAPSAMAGKIRNRIKEFPALHERLREVQIENQDYRDCMRDYDGHDTVFYLDPPYIDAHAGTYKHELSQADHITLLNTIHETKGYVALSGYSNPFYEEYPWDHRHSWKVGSTMKAKAYTEGNGKLAIKEIDDHSPVEVEEVLWIKEAK